MQLQTADPPRGATARTTGWCLRPCSTTLPTAYRQSITRRSAPRSYALHVGRARMDPRPSRDLPGLLLLAPRRPRPQRARPIPWRALFRCLCGVLRTVDSISLDPKYDTLPLDELPLVYRMLAPEPSVLSRPQEKSSSAFIHRMSVRRPAAKSNGGNGSIWPDVIALPSSTGWARSSGITLPHGYPTRRT